jgi:2-polyprenyl-3-methyl-5-hydroxy-6-metoxy-1,4-benzoquinol methylase
LARSDLKTDHMIDEGKKSLMQSYEYYDWSRERDLDKDDGAPFSDWMANPNHPSSFTVHPDGFLIFLRPNDISDLDEYSEEDPYRVSGNLDGPFHAQRIHVTIDMLAQAIGREARSPKILDVACGEGHITAAIHRAFPTARILAFDGSLSAIRSASQAHDGISFALANAYDPPYPPDYFDCVVCNNIWEHVPDPLRLLDRVARSLKPNGHLIVSTPSRYKLNNLLRVLIGKPVVLGSPHHVTEYSVGQIQEQLRYAGFELEKVAGKLLRLENPTLRTRITYGIGALLNGLLRLNRSHHNLGSTVFFLAKKAKIK